MRKQKTHTTATRSPPKNLGKVKDLSAAHDVYWVLMPLHKSGPYGDGCISPGDFSVSATKDQFFANLFNIMATVVEEPKDGGWLLDVSKDNQRLRDSVIEGIAKFEMGESDPIFVKWLEKRAHQGRFFDPEVTNAVQKAKNRIAKENLEKKNRKSAKNRAKSEIMCVFGQIVLTDTKNRFSQKTINPKGFLPASFRTWQTDDDRRALAQLRAEENDQEELVNTSSEITDDDISAAAIAINDPDSGVHTKWEVVMYALPENEYGIMDVEQDEHLYDDDSTRAALVKSFNVCKKHRTKDGRKVAAVLWAFVQYDETINPGKTIKRMIDNVPLRDNFYSGGRNIISKYDTGYNDPFIRLCSYIDREHPVHTINKTNYWNWSRLYRNEKRSSNTARNAKTIYHPDERKGKTHPAFWATLDNALRLAKCCNVDMSGLKPENFIVGMQERLGTGISAEKAIRGPDGFIRLKVPTETFVAGGITTDICDSWVWKEDTFRQLGGDNMPGIFEMTFPFINQLSDNIEFGGQSLEARRFAIAEHSASGNPDTFETYHADQEEIINGIREKISPEGFVSREVAIAEFLNNYHKNEWETLVARISKTGAPFHSDDVMVDNYYRKNRLEVETLKHFVHPDKDLEAYSTKFVPAMERHTQVTMSWFKDAMRISAPINRNARAVLQGTIDLRNSGMKTLTATQYLHDCGKPISEDDLTIRDPEYPGLDSFAHFKIKYIRQLRQNKGVEDPLTVSFASKVLSSCYHFRPGRPLPLIVLSSPAGEGKTYVLMVLKSLSIKGTTRQENHVSDMVATAGEDVDAAILTDEAKGILQKAKDASVNATEIGKAQTAGTGTVASQRAEYIINPETGKRELSVDEREYVHSKAWLIGTNAKKEELVPEMAARTIWFDKPKSFVPASALSFKKFAEWAKHTKDWNQVMQIAHFHLYKGVQNGAIQSFHDMPVVNLIFTWMRNHLRSRGIEPMEGEHENRTHAKIRQCIIVDMLNSAIAAAIHTPGGTCYNDEMDMNLWLRISPLLYPTLQVIFWNIISLGHMWVSTNISHVLVAMLQVCNYDYEPGKTPAQICCEDTDDKINWRSRKHYLTEEQQAQRIVESGQNSNHGHRNNDSVEFLKDLNYVSVLDTPTFWNQVSNAMPLKHRQSPSWIKMMVRNTSTKQMFRPIGGKYPFASADDITKMRESNPIGNFHKWSNFDDSRVKTEGSFPIIEITKIRNCRRIYIATGAPAVMGGNELITAFLMSVVSGKFTPRAFLLPITHPDHRDILEKMVIRGSDRDRIVSQIDAKIEQEYRQLFMDEESNVETESQRDNSETERGENVTTMMMMMSEDSESNVETESQCDNSETERGGNATTMMMMTSEDSESCDVEVLNEPENQSQNQQIEESSIVIKRKAVLTGDWDTDKKLLCRKYGIAVIDEGYISRTDEIICFDGGHEYDPALEKGWDKIKKKILKERTTKVEQITMDLDEWSAKERWIKCGLRMKDDSGNSVKIPSPQENERRYWAYMMKHKEMVVSTFNYPEDEIEERKQQERPRKILNGLHDIDLKVGSMFSHGGISNKRRKRSSAPSFQMSQLQGGQPNGNSNNATTNNFLSSNGISGISIN